MSGGHFNYKQYEFGQIADEIEQAPHVRLLLGAEPEQEVVRAIEVCNAFVD